MFVDFLGCGFLVDVKGSFLFMILEARIVFTAEWGFENIQPGQF
jgi:hypothetical protein